MGERVNVSASLTHEYERHIFGMAYVAVIRRGYS